MKKYEITNESKKLNGRTLYRIRAINSFGGIKAGELGGWIEKENNLSQIGDAWVDGNAIVSGGATVGENAWIRENARVDENAQVDGNVLVGNDAVVRGNAWVTDDAVVRGNAVVEGNVLVCGNTLVRGNAMVWGSTQVDGNARISTGAIIFANDDWCTYTGFGREYRTTTAYRTRNGVSIVCGCYEGTLEEFEKQVESTHSNDKYGQEYKLMIDMIRVHFDMKG